MNPIKFHKVKFSSSLGSTAGLIFESDRLERMSMQDISRAFPYAEALKMSKLHVSPAYDTWEGAFGHEF